MKKLFWLILIPALLVSVSSCFKSKGGPVVQPGETAKGKVIITWATESEEDNYGFNIYRGKTKDGPFVKINKEIIQGAGTANDRREYIYADQPLEIGDTYYYYIESVSFAGQKEAFTPVSPVVVKMLMDAPAETK